MRACKIGFTVDLKADFRVDFRVENFKPKQTLFLSNLIVGNHCSLSSFIL